MSYTIDSTTYRSPNYDDRPANSSIWALVIHTCEGKPPGDEQQSSIPWLCNPDSGVSSHAYITREGLIYQLVDDSKRAWHAGVSMLKNVWYCNNYSIGVELEHRSGAAPYPPIQLQALTWYCQQKIKRYGIVRDAVETHRRVATNAGLTDRSDPTDWPDAAFYAWVDTLYAPLGRYSVLAPCTVLTDRRPDAPLAGGPHNGQTQLQTGMQINVGDVTDGWLWVSDGPATPPGIGFIPSSYARPL